VNLDGRAALVTGAAHRVGRAIALALGRRGARVAVHYGGSAEAAESTVEKLRRLGTEAVSMQADLAQPDEIDTLFEGVAETLGGLDLLFVSTPFDEIDAEEWDRVLAVNLRAPFLCTQAAARLMRATERPAGASGLVINITDLSALGVWRGFAHHSVSKAGLLHLTRVAAWELAPEVRVNAIAPGAILPPPGVPVDGEEWQHRGADVPVGRTGSPEQIGSTVVFLAENDFLNGAVVPVDGGEHLTQGGRG
jgi:NAD(P)-dependent dehydrogenase (short-subunit alcohol dehydrogenase family)